ncbi:hypothetical protein HHL19_24640 [Streptomyces sp. R302]|uniref:hypothetical protein n=1 Tax=unclassified Streptomyces TaxID=2593676 RepID=UPI00145CF638|nr:MULTISPECIES: hypothetical protein [unclassified Streptomyces]NML54491.1 hypothetical protein [Streptomyces sp. R301]NML81753.1 hypothetical protein [Streptomyces sp. R302]
MLARTARPLAAASGLALAGLAVFGGGQAAYAAPGDNGDVKIHKSTTPVNDPRNEPKVCLFYLAAFNFDDGQEITWKIEHQPGGGAVEDGEITLPTGGGRASSDLGLPDGMYKLTWNFAGEQGAGKHKVFRVDCENGNGGNGHHKPPHGPVGAGGGGSAEIAAEEGASALGVGAAVAAGLAGAAGLVLIRRSRRRNDGAA